MEGYGDICARFYDLDKPYAPALATDWYMQRLAEKIGDPTRDRVLEPMCGSGRFLVKLVQSGLLVDGADPSPSMLKRCHDKCVAAGLGVESPFGNHEGSPRVRLWQRALQELEPGDQRYAAAFIPSGSFCLLHEPEEAHLALKRLHGQLEPGAPVLIEFELPHPEINWPGEAVKTVTDGGTQIRLVSRVGYDFATQIETYHNTYELKQSGKTVATEEETIHLHCYAPDEIRHELQTAGFKDIPIEHPDFGWGATGHA